MMITASKQVKVTVALPAFLQSERYLFENILLYRKGKISYVQQRLDTTGWTTLFNLLVQDNHSTPPFAALSAMGNGFQVNHGWWLHVDPIELLVDGGNICLVGSDHLSLLEEESRSLITTVNSLLKLDNLTLLYGSPHAWYLHFPDEPHIKTKPLTDVIAKDIRSYLPSGNRQAWWHRLLTEIQMLLFEHSVNINRQRLGKPAINSVWFWGEGKLMAPYKTISYSAVWSNIALVKGIIDHAQPTIPFFGLHDFSESIFNNPGHYLIAYNHYYDTSFIETFSGFLDYLEKGVIHEFTIYLGDERSYKWSVKRSFFSRFCKGSK